MAGNNYRIEKGQRLSSAVSARAWNRAQDAADVVLGSVLGNEAGDNAAGARAANIILLRNDSGIVVPQFGVLRIGSPLVLNDLEKPSQFGENMVLSGLMPNGLSPFAVAVEPIETGKIGRCAIGGRFACKVKIVDADHKYARSRNNDVTQLISAACGDMRFLWKESGTGDDKFAAGVM
jgi:hypothetical protein